MDESPLPISLAAARDMPLPVGRRSAEVLIDGDLEVRFYAPTGVLASYGTDYPELFRQAAEYVDKTLKGAKPADLPVRQPTKFELIVEGSGRERPLGRAGARRRSGGLMARSGASRAAEGCPSVISRRAIVAGAAALLSPLGVGAQPRVYRLGMLMPGGDVVGPGLRALFARLEDLGYREGHNLAVDRRFAHGRLERLPTLVAELLAAKPDVLFAAGTQAALAAAKATRTIPVVFAYTTDPVGLGIVKSLRQPGTNATGVSNQADEAQIKLLQLVKEAFPSASDVAILYNPLNTSEVRTLSALRKAAPAVGVQVRAVEARTPEDLVPAFNAMKARRPDVLYVMGGPLADTHRERVVALVNGQRQPTVYGLTSFVEAGGLMSYSFSFADQGRAAAAFVDKILRGASPAVLPVEQPNRFELTINAKTVKALGITIPPGVLLRADRVIDP